MGPHVIEFPGVLSLIAAIDLAADVNDFNDHAYRRFVEKLKVGTLGININIHTDKRQDAVDPNGILSSGKQGIWGEKYRQFRDPTAPIADAVDKLATQTASTKL